MLLGVGSTNADPLLTFALPDYVVAPAFSPVVVPLLIQNDGSDPFTFHVPRGVQYDPLLNFNEGSGGSGSELSQDHFFGLLRNLPIFGADAFYDQEFFELLNGVVLNAHQEIVIPWYTFTLFDIYGLDPNTISSGSDKYFSGVLGTYVGRAGFGFDYRIGDQWWSASQGTLFPGRSDGWLGHQIQ
jgi:hypothetical protein